MSALARSPLALLAAIFLLRAPGLVYGVVDIDETDWVTIAQMVERGASLYADVAEKKPPLSYWFYIPFAPLGFRVWPVQLAAILWVFATCLVVRRAAAAWTEDEDAGWAAAWMCAAVSACNVFSVNAELMLNLPAALALLAFVRAERSRMIALDLACGAAIGASAAFKHQAGILLAAFSLAIVLTHARGAVLRGVARIAALTAGFVLVWAALAAMYAASGHLDDFVEWNFTRNFLYINLGAGSVLRRAAEGITLFVLLAAPIPWALALLATTRERRTLPPGRIGVLLALWMTWIPVALGGRFYAHYFLQLAPPLAIAAAPGAVALWRRRASLGAAARRGLVLAAILPLVLFQAIGLGRYLAGDFPNQEQRARELAAWIAAHTTPDDRLFVWGHYTPIYYLSERVPGTRYTNTSVHMGDFDPGHITPDLDLTRFHSARDIELTIQDLERHQPRLVVDTAPADIHAWSRVPLADFPRIDRYVREHYRLVAEPGGARVYERNPAR